MSKTRKPFDISKAKKGDLVVAFAGRGRFPGIVHAVIPAGENHEAQVLIDHCDDQNPDKDYELRPHLGDLFIDKNKRETGTSYELWGVDCVYAARRVGHAIVERVR